MKKKTQNKKQRKPLKQPAVKHSASELIPTTWLDPLLTGKDKVIGEHPYNGKDIERLLSALKKRIEEYEKHCA